MWLNEPLIVDGPVSARLLAAAPQAKDVYRSFYSHWNPQLADVEVRAETHSPGPATPTAGYFFTRGVDSWYSVLNGAAGSPNGSPGPMSVLLYWPTADFFAGRPSPGLAQRLRSESSSLIRVAAERTGHRLVLIDSNLRALVEPQRNWAYTHGALLASIGLALGFHLARVHIAGSLELGNLVPQGSHPELDPLWSTERTEIVHDGAQVSRVEKLRALARHPVALEHLKVCINQSSDANCGACPKCVRTMVGLRLAGASEAGPTFDARLKLRRVARVVPRYGLEWAFHRELEDALERSDGHRMLHAAHRCAGAQAKFRARVRRA